MVGAWIRLLVNSATVAGSAVAAQLGAGNALGIIRWDGQHDARGWTTLLSWVAFSYAVAVLAGALAGRLALRRRHGSDGIGTRLAAALVAAAGAAVSIGLAWLPARDANPPINVNPGLVVSLTAGGGVMVGLVLALVALAARPVAVGLQVMVAWLWLVAIAAAIAGITSHDAYPAPRLGVPDAASLVPATPWTGPRVMIIVAVVVGAVVAGVARASGSPRLGAALSGPGGPALIAAAYLIAGPGPGVDITSADGAYLDAVLATAAGLAASVLVAVPGRRAEPADQPRTLSGRLQPTDDQPLEGDVIEAIRARAATTTAQGRVRPAWAEGSGVYARAYTGAGAGRTPSDPTRPEGAAPTASPSALPRREPLTVAAGGTAWSADTLTGTSSAVDPGRHAQPKQVPGAGLYRSGGTAVDDLYESGRHAAQE
ncbi:MAG TPA: hypothetical protein VH561_00780 [Micromonosporaceae bacterium]